MAKVFTIDFHYKADTYPALVTVRSKDGEQFVHVHLFDEALNNFIGDEGLEFTISNNLKRHTDNYSPQKRELMKIIREVVVNHLKDTASI
jgi:hypothetical protein